MSQVAPDLSPANLLIKTGQVARLLCVSSPTVRVLVTGQRLAVAGRTPGGHALYRLQDVLALQSQLGGSESCGGWLDNGGLA